jgi:hypothetical protein
LGGVGGEGGADGAQDGEVLALAEGGEWREDEPAFVHAEGVEVAGDGRGCVAARGLRFGLESGGWYG